MGMGKGRAGVGILIAIIAVLTAAVVLTRVGQDYGTRDSYNHGYNQGLSTGYNNAVATVMARPSTPTPPSLLPDDWPTAATLALEIHNAIPRASIKVTGGTDCPANMTQCYYAPYEIDVTLNGQSISIYSRQDWLHDRSTLIRLERATSLKGG